MDTLLSIFRSMVTDAIENAFGNELGPNERIADITPCAQEEFGHYQCNSALRLAKLLKQSPRSVAQKILEHFNSENCDKVDIAGPGFINFVLSPKFLSKELQGQLHDPLLGASKPKVQQKIIIDFSSPNVAKELHVGHLRSTIIGDCLARLFEFLEQDVVRLNHIGDWGTQFGMLISYLEEVAPNVLDGKEEASLEALMNWYKASKKRFDEDAEFKKRSQKKVVSLQMGDEKTILAWKMICEISRRAYQEIYNLLDVEIEERGESFYNPYLKSVIDELEKKNLVALSDGAKCIFLEGFKNREGDTLPMIIQKSDGGYNYDTTDLATIRYRIQNEGANRIIYVTDIGQSVHFQMVFKVAEMAGWLDPKKVKVDHVGFGLVLGQDGKKFKTRSGETEKLIDLLTEAIHRSKKIILERDPLMKKEDVDSLAKVIGIDAVKYADLSSHRTKDYTFSYDRMLRFEGNTAVFLLYAYVRINGIKRKLGAAFQKNEKHQINVKHPAEISLGLHLRRFGEVLENLTKDLLPNRLTEYLYILAEKFNLFFRDCKVIGSNEQESRLILCELTAKVLKQGLEILGLETVEKM